MAVSHPRDECPSLLEEEVLFLWVFSLRIWISQGRQGKENGCSRTWEGRHTNKAGFSLELSQVRHGNLSCWLGSLLWILPAPLEPPWLMHHGTLFISPCMVTPSLWSPPTWRPFRAECPPLPQGSCLMLWGHLLLRPILVAADSLVSMKRGSLTPHLGQLTPWSIGGHFPLTLCGDLD